MIRLLGVFLFIQLSLISIAQTNIELRRAYKDPLFQVAPRIDFIFDKPKINVYLAGVVNNKGTYKSLVENRQWYAQAGIDIGMPNKLFLGLSIRANGGASNFNIYNYTTKLSLQHRGKMGQLLFVKDISYEHFNFSDKTAYSVTSSGVIAYRRSAEGRLGLGLGLGKYFMVDKNYIAVFLSYKAHFQFDFNGNELYKNRFVDHSALRMEIGYLINHTWYVGMYVSRDTNFLYIPALTAYNENRITPILGLACNLLLFSKPENEKELSSFRYLYTQL